ncbi:17684_t:CDS:1, partial [Funneliformis caledonium]
MSGNSILIHDNTEHNLDEKTNELLEFGTYSCLAKLSGFDGVIGKT